MISVNFNHARTLWRVWKSKNEAETNLTWHISMWGKCALSDRYPEIRYRLKAWSQRLGTSHMCHELVLSRKDWLQPWQYFSSTTLYNQNVEMWNHPSHGKKMALAVVVARRKPRMKGKETCWWRRLLVYRSLQNEANVRYFALPSAWGWASTFQPLRM